MSADGGPHTFDFLGPGELEAMENHWRRGQLQPQVARVLGFVEKHRGTILQMAGGQNAASVLQATRRLIEQTGSLDPAAEAREQVREMEKEMWYRGEKGDLDRQKVPPEWIASHAANWRRWRDKEYLFIVVRCKAEVLERLTGGHLKGECCLVRGAP